MCLFISLAVSVRTAWAGCTDVKVTCVTEGNIKKVGTLHVGRCWEWKKLTCVICHGNAYPAKQCNKKFEEQKCEGKCWAWFQDDYWSSEEHCYDEEGHKHRF